MVYTLENDHQRGQLRRVGIVPGITDNRYTEVVSGELEPGGQVVVEDRQAAAAASPPAGTLPDTAVLMRASSATPSGGA